MIKCKIMKLALGIIALILLVVLIFFYRLFFPIPSLFYTPDFGRSDMWHYNYPMKDFLAKSLKNRQLPFWSSKIGTGFPVFADSQIGTLNLFNLLLFYLFPTWLAWNLSLIIVFFTAFLGTYLFLKNCRLGNWASFLGGFIFAFNGFFICHIPHFNLVQTASFLPWLFLLAKKILKQPTFCSFFIFALILSQQIFTGHSQITFITLLGISVFGFANMNLPIYKKSNKKLLILFFAILFGLLLSASQLLPSLELTRISIRKTGISLSTIFEYPYPLKHLVTFILPNFFGTPKNGSYPPYQAGSWGIYWENTAYLGILPILFLFISLLKKNKKPVEKIFWFILIFSLLLVLGSSSPLYFLFSFPGFNLFRVPSRFLLLTAFSITVLAAFSFNQITNFFKKQLNSKYLLFTVYCLLFTVSVVDLFHFGFNYHPLVPVQKALEKPESAAFVENNARIYNPPTQTFIAWNKYFLKNGWQDISPYLYFKNSLAEDLNLLFDKTHAFAFYGLPTERQYYQESLLSETSSNQTIKQLSAVGVKYIITPEKIENDNLILKTTIQPPLESLPAYYIYQNSVALPRFHSVSNFQLEKTVKGFYRLATEDDFSFTNSVVLENSPKVQFDQLKKSSLTVQKETDQQIVLKTETDKKSILVIADSYYPGWQATIDNQKTKILPANINQRAIILPPGKHLVNISYYPKTFYQGVFVSLLSLLIFIPVAKRILH